MGTQWPWCALQDVWEGKRAQAAYHAIMRELLADVRARASAGKLLDSSVAGHLLRIRQPGSGAALSDDLLLPEVAVFFFAGKASPCQVRVGVCCSVCCCADK